MAILEADALSEAGQELPPVAPSLMHSLRALGYTTAAALSDLIDNSIAAEAHVISINFRPVAEPFLTIVDDGFGMSEPELVDAMRFGSRDPREIRASTDLGRFGLGLKTASLSQCKRLTVVTLRDGVFSAARWDIEECDRRQSWWLERPDVKSVNPGIIETLSQQGHGTAVIWEKLDRLLESGTGPNPDRLDAAMENAADQIALSFHRFLSGEMVGHLIYFNSRPLPKLDPFLEGHVTRSEPPRETLSVDGHPVLVSPFVLPFPSSLRTEDLDRAGGRESLKSATVSMSTEVGAWLFRGMVSYRPG